MLEIGWSYKQFSVEGPVVIPGQFRMRISEGCHDPITLTALAIDSGEDYVIFLQCDIIAAYNGFLEEICEYIKRKNPQINTDKVLLHATHTHNSPLVAKGESAGVWGSLDDYRKLGFQIESPEKFTELFTESAADVVCEAFESRKGGYIAYGYGFGVIGHNRRVVYSKERTKHGDEVSAGNVKGYAKMYGDTNDEAFSHYESGADPFINIMFTFDNNEKLTGAVINIPCPSQSSENESFISSDFWYDIRNAIKEKYGDIYILAQCAAGGDVSPRILHYDKAQSRRYRLKYSDRKLSSLVRFENEMYSRWDIAERVVDCFDEVYSWASKEKYRDIPIIHSVKKVELDKRIITDEEYENSIKELALLKKEERQIGKADDLIEKTKLLSAMARSSFIIKRWETQKTEPKVLAEIHVIRIGNIAFATNGFELFVDFQHRIQANSPFEQTFIIQLCAQKGRRSSSYIATERACENLGYGATMYCNIVSPRGGQQLVFETVKELKRLYNK